MEQKFAYNMKDISLEDTPSLPADYVHVPQTKKSEVNSAGPSLTGIHTKLLFMRARGIELTLDNLLAEYRGWANEIDESEVVAICEEAGILEHLTNN